MSYLDCAQYDCCHNKAGCCCLDGINVRHTGPGDAVCGSYRNSEGYGNVATDNQPASPETDIHCDDKRLPPPGRPLLLCRPRQH